MSVGSVLICVRHKRFIEIPSRDLRFFDLVTITRLPNFNYREAHKCVKALCGVHAINLNGNEQMNFSAPEIVKVLFTSSDCFFKGQLSEWISVRR